MRSQEVIGIIGLGVVIGVFIFLVTVMTTPTGHVIFTQPKEVRISYFAQNPEKIELEKDVAAKILIDDPKIKDCFDVLNETETGIKPIAYRNNTLEFIPKKGGNITFLCGSINTKIVVK